MSTRCLIAIENPDKTYDVIYCHFDGYVRGGVGEELFKNYKERRKVENLISLGNRRQLVETAPENELYNEPYTKYNNLDELIEELKNMIEYIYIFDLNDKWMTIR